MLQSFQSARRLAGASRLQGRRMSNIESRIAALEGVGAARIIFEMWIGENCPDCSTLIWKESTTGQTRNMRPEDARGCARVISAATPPHRCKVNS